MATGEYDPRSQMVVDRQVVEAPIDPFGEYARNVDHGIREDDHMVSAQGVLPWHGLGTVLPSAGLSAEEALQYAHLDWLVEKRPIYADLGTKDGYGNPVTSRVENAWATVRMDTGRALAPVGDRYRVVQNQEAIDWMDALLGGEGFNIVTAGSLFNGRRVWVLAKVPFRVELPDSPIDTYVMILNNHDGSGCVIAVCTPIRAVCNNTCGAAVRAAFAQYKIRHSRNAESKLAEAQKVLGLAKGAAERMKIVAEELAAKKISDNEFTYFLNKLVEMPKDDGRAKTMASNAQEQIARAYRTAPGQEEIQGTAWGAFNAVTYYVDRLQPNRSGIGTKDENKFLRSVATVNLADRALALLK